jgi:glycosyl hydrolase family 42 (putative beta-galactosidase)
MEMMTLRRKSIKQIALNALFAALAATYLAHPARTAAEVPRGVFALSTGDRVARPASLESPAVDGISIRASWGAIEPKEGVFDWTFIDSEVARAAAAGKVVLLRIGTQTGKPQWVIDAITAAGGSFYSFDDDGVPAKIPVFWDPTFLAKKQAMIGALGARYTKNPTVRIVTASFANASSEDWAVPHTPDQVKAWLAVGYTTQKMLDAGKQIIDATMKAFPNQYVAMAIGSDGNGGGGLNLDPDATYVARNVTLTARAAWPGRFLVQINSLSAHNPPAPGPDGSVWNLLWNNKPDVAGQMVFNCFGEPTYRVNGGVADAPADVLRRSIDAGISYGMKYIEIYQPDVASLPAEITYAHERLLGLASSQQPSAPSGLNVTP